MVPRKLKCFVNYLGCEKRKIDAQRVVNYLRANGYQLTGRISDANVVVFLTCAFCNKYENYSVAKLGKIYAQRQPDAVFIIGGCLPAINPNRLAPYTNGIQINVRELDSLDKILEARVLMREIQDPNTTIFDRKDDALPHTSGFKSPAEKEYETAKRGYKIRVNWGCVNNCSYCVTRLAEGKLTSKVEDEILMEFKRGLDAGFTSFFITGGDTGAYGLDLKSSIVNLLTKILSIAGKYTLHFHDFGVQWVIRYLPELISLFQEHSQNLGCFCFPIQSGSKKILQLMRRPYLVEEVVTSLHALKKAIPTIKIGTHFIVGFPGETDEDFGQTVQLLKEVPFDFVEIYRYKDHDKADSHAFSNKVPRNVIVERNATLDQVFKEKFVRNS